MELLELINQPAFCVKEEKIIAANHSALQHQFAIGQQVESFLTEHLEDYRAFEDGVLYLRVLAAGVPCDASVTPTEQGNLFVLDDIYSGEGLKAMALCAQHLRPQLENAMSAAREQSQPDGTLLRSLYKMQRGLLNMADVARYRVGQPSLETIEIGSVIYELMEKAAALLHRSGRTLRYTGLRESVFTEGNYELLERAVYNLVSNAVKFSEADSVISASLVKKEHTVVLTVEDDGDGISSDMYASVFSRYQRQPGIEDGRHGIGLGLALVQSAAAIHGGTILVTRSKNGGSKISFSIAIRPSNKDIVRTPALKLSDYAGGNDHALLELSDVLSNELYRM